MTTKEKLNLLQSAVAQLTELYRELADELPRLEFVGAPAPANSELKKMPRRLYNSGQKRWKSLIQNPRITMEQVKAFFLSKRYQTRRR